MNPRGTGDLTMSCPKRHIFTLGTIAVLTALARPTAVAGEVSEGSGVLKMAGVSGGLVVHVAR